LSISPESNHDTIFAVVVVDYDVTHTWIYQLTFVPIGNQTVHFFSPLLQLSCHLLNQPSTQLQLVSLAANNTL
jgi:hypothetical protein